MKKVYAAMALALAVSASASANVNPAEMEAMQLGTKANVELTSLAEGTEAVAGPKKMTPQKFNSISDLYGYQVWRYVMGLKGYDGWQMGTLGITPNDKHGYVTVTGFFSGYPVEAKASLADKTLSFYRQPLFYSGYYKMQIDLIPMYWSSDSSVDPLAEGTPYVIRYRPDGVELEDKDGNKDIYYKDWWVCEDFEHILGATQDGLEGYFMLAYMNLFQPLGDVLAESRIHNVFYYNESEWKAAGKASFTDGWLGAVFEEGGQVGPYDVDIYLNAKNPRRILLMNPYGKGTPYENANQYEGDGYIVLDASNPECVVVQPLVESGFMNDEYFANGMFLMSSVEGELYYLQSADYEDIIATNEYYFRENAELDGNVILLPNCRFTGPYDIFNYDQWVNSDEDLIEMVSMIELPVDLWDGVEGVVDDVNLGVKRYFNLQGMEVSPVKGQIVIVRNGNKSTKMVVR